MPVPRILLLCLLVALPAGAWTPATQEQIAEQAARLAPPDLHRQLARHRRAYLEGVAAPFYDRQPAHHTKNDDGSGRLDQVILQAVDNAVRSIQTHQTFEETSHRLGIVSHYLADANNPLNASQDDPEEGRYFADYLQYVESAQPRIAVMFYGFPPRLDRPEDVTRLVRDALVRGRALYPLVGREYRRVGFRPGREAFDDRSTAYGVAAVAFSHAVSDIAQVLRYIWLAAGGIDTRPALPIEGQDLLPVPRSPAAP